jgi:hypothetical protein
VDACQLRLDRAALRAYGERGFVVMLTGSKFFTGPPFAGALLVPRAIAERVRASKRALEGLAAYSTGDAWPRAWRHVPASLESARNLGLLLRWEAALWEIRVFRAVPAARAHATLSRFGETIARAIAERPHLGLLPTPPLQRPDAGDGTWDALATIFTFTVRRPDGTLAPLAALRELYDWLNQDVSTCLPDDATARERHVAAKRCHIGQPIALGQAGGVELAVLRISGGARLVSGVAFDPGLGETEESRLAQELGDARLVFEKIDLVLAHWARIAERFVPRPE